MLYTYYIYCVCPLPPFSPMIKEKHRQFLEISTVSVLAVAMTYGMGYFSKTGRRMSGTESAVVVLLADVIRAFLCFLLRSLYERENKIVYHKEYLLCGLLSFFQSVTWLFSIQSVYVFALQIISNTRIVFVFLLSVAFLNRKYSWWQWMAQIGIVIGIVCPHAWERYISSAQKEDSKSEAFHTILYLGFVTLSCLSSAFSGVYFEMTIKKRKIPFWSNSMYYSISGVIISFMYLASATAFKRDIKTISITGKMSLIILFKVLEGFVYSYVILNYAAIVKAFIQLVLNCFISIVMSLHLGEPIRWPSLVSLAIIVLSVIVFNLRSTN